MRTNRDQPEIPEHLLHEVCDVKDDFSSSSTSSNSSSKPFEDTKGKGSSLDLVSNDSFETTLKKPVEHEDHSLSINNLNMLGNNNSFEITWEIHRNEFVAHETDSFETPLKTSQKECLETPMKTYENEWVETPRKNPEDDSSETPLKTCERDVNHASDIDLMERRIKDQDEEIKRLKEQVEKFNRLPGEHDDRTDITIGQLKTKDEQIRQLEKEIEELRHINYQLDEKRKRTTDNNYLKTRLKELELQVEEGKNRLYEAEQRERGANEKLAEKKSNLSMAHEENATLTLQLKNALSEANRFANIIRVQQEEFANAKAEDVDRLNKMEYKLRFAEEQSRMDATKITAMKRENKRLHGVIRTLNPNKRREADICGQCQQFHVSLAEGPCLYHPVAPLRYDVWKHLPKLRESAEDPNLEDYWYYLCCEKLDKLRPRGCCKHDAHDAGLCGLHSPYMREHQ